MSINILPPRPRGATKTARTLASVEGHIIDGIVPVRDVRLSLLREYRRLDTPRDRAVRIVVTLYREAMEQTSLTEAVRLLRQGQPLLSQIGIYDAMIDQICLEQAPVSLEEAHDALLAGVRLCESFLVQQDETCDEVLRRQAECPHGKIA